MPVFVSYAQNFEDVMLWRALKHVPRGQYVDVGASDPVRDSVSLAFYQHGWRGIHVEPLPHQAQALRDARPDETVLEMALGETDGALDFYRVVDSDGLSTGASETAELHRAAGHVVEHTRIPCRRLAEVLDQHTHGEVHWLKIDVESLEEQVIRGWAPSPVRPWIVVVESTLPASPELRYQHWEPMLLEMGYRFVYCDGLNRFYLAAEHPELAAAFTCGPNVFDGFVLSPWSGLWLPRPARVAPIALDDPYGTSAPLEPPPPPAPTPPVLAAPLPLPLRLARRMVGQGLRLARAGIRRCPRLKAALLAGLHRVPWLFSLVARLAERLRGPRATPLLEAPPPPPPSPPEARSPEHSALRLLRLAREHGGQG